MHHYFTRWQCGFDASHGIISLQISSTDNQSILHPQIQTDDWFHIGSILLSSPCHLLAYFVTHSCQALEILNDAMRDSFLSKIAATAIHTTAHPMADLIPWSPAEHFYALRDWDSCQAKKAQHHAQRLLWDPWPVRHTVSNDVFSAAQSLVRIHNATCITCSHKSLFSQQAATL